MILAGSRWRLRQWQIMAIGLVFLVMDVALFSSNATKFFHGAWVPVALGIMVFTLMRTWRRGRALVRAQIDSESLRIEHFVANLMAHPPQRVEGTAIFLTPSSQLVPPALLHNLKHNKVLHARNVLLSVDTLQVPRAEEHERVVHTDLGNGFSRLSLRFGYMEDPDVPRALATWTIPDAAFEPMDTTFFASRDAIVAKKDRGMALWRDKLFLLMSRNARPATEFFSVPGNRLVELGTQVVI
jgi:KUP system potassium uptake protein